MQRNRLHSVMRQEKERERKQIWLIVGVIVAATAIACAYILMRMKKHQRRSEDNLNRELDKTRRQLTVERLRDVEKSGSDAEWEKFEAVFVKMHPNFSDTLKSKYSNLTRGDLRMCALLSMDMDTKHIAKLLNINPESVKKSRQRLRAKLGLNPDVAWTDFFNTILQ